MSSSIQTDLGSARHREQIDGLTLGLSFIARASRYLKNGFEASLWRTRYVVIVAVISTMVASLSVFAVATVDTIIHLTHITDYIRPPDADKKLSPEELSRKHEELRKQTIVHVIEAIDAYLLATVLLIFALGLYTLFINRLEAAEHSKSSAGLLVIHSLDDLKDRLSQVILLILVVEFFEQALKRDFSEIGELLRLSIGILLIAGALYLSHRRSSSSPITTKVRSSAA